MKENKEEIIGVFAPDEDKPREECGIIGFWNRNDFDTAQIVAHGMYGIQHRGQESAGIAVNDNGKIFCQKELGLVSEVFNDIVIKHLSGGRVGVGHCGLLNQKELIRENAQPLVLRYTKGQMAIAYNGCILNGKEMRETLENDGYMLQSESDAEVLAIMLSKIRVRVHSIEEALAQVMKKIKGSYSILIMTPHKLIAARDGYGIKPLCFGFLDDSVMFASETTGLDMVGARFERDVVPGEIIVVEETGMRSIHTNKTEKSAMCIFEFVYFARADSTIDGANVYISREEAGRVLARECPADADLVVGVPDSGIAAAMGYSQESGIPYASAIVKNRYITRTFIQPTQEMREMAVGLKLNPIRELVKGKRIVLVDDSIVRGTTCKKMIKMLRELGGVKEIHLRVSSPPVRYSCRYGIDTHDEKTLVANVMSLEETAEYIGADSIGYISPEGLLKSPIGAKCGFCSACFDAKYPLTIEK